MAKKFARPYKMWVAIPWVPYVYSITVVRHSPKQCWRVPERGGAPYVMRRFERIYDTDRCTVFERKLEAMAAAVEISKVYLDVAKRDLDAHLRDHHAAAELLKTTVMGLLGKIPKRGRKNGH